jgi:Kef-type K+ transport system membrane component KefB
MSSWELAARLALAIVVTLVAAHGMGRAVRHIRQPPVIGEMLCGLVLGPTVLGALPGDPSKALFPPQVTDVLSTIGQVGVVAYVFLLGLNLSLRNISKSGSSVIKISMASLIVPFTLGAILGSQLYDSHQVVAGKVVEPVAFTLFMGTAFAMTAFPVLARILTDTGLHRDRLGGITIACAAVLDAFGWMMLAIAVAVATSKGSGGLVRTGVGAAAIVAALVLLRPLVGRLVASQPVLRRPPAWFIVTILAMVGASAAATQAIGLHPLLGAVLFGALYPRRRNPITVAALDATLSPIAVSVLLPIFFLVPGLHIDLRHMGGGGVVELVLILLVACAGKYIGAGLASRASGYGWRESSVIATLMNTRGLIELVVLSVGYSEHVLDGELYGLMVVMTLFTTMMAGPILHAIYKPGLTQARPARTRGWLPARTSASVTGWEAGGGGSPGSRNPA